MAQVLSLTDEERERAEKARAEAEAARRAADEKLAAEAEARRKRDAERVKLQLAPSAPPPPAKPAGPTKEQLEAAAAKVCPVLLPCTYIIMDTHCSSVHFVEISFFKG
jgi:hypothetical protein